MNESWSGPVFNPAPQGDGDTEYRPWLAKVDGSLARGFVRQEARQIGDAHEEVRKIPADLVDMIMPRFRARRRLSLPELEALAEEFDAKVASAFNSIFSSVTCARPGKVRPDSPRYEIVHYLVKAENQPPDENGRVPKDRTMRLCVFSATLERRAITMGIRGTPVCFYEHAARQYLVRGGSEHEAAVRTIALRLARTILMPVLAFEIDGRAVTGSRLSIPLADGLLLGGFEPRPYIGRHTQGTGGRVAFNKRGRFNRDVPLGMTTDFVIKTYVDPGKLGPDQREIVREVEAWLGNHEAAAEATMLHRYRLDLEEPEKGSRFVVPQAVKADFRSMRDRVFGPTPLLHTAQFLMPWTAKARL